MALQQLHLPYCNITEEAGSALGEMVMYSKCGLTTLNLMVRLVVIQEYIGGS